MKNLTLQLTLACMFWTIGSTHTNAQPVREETGYLNISTISDVSWNAVMVPTNDNGLFIGETTAWYNPGGITHQKCFANKYWGTSPTRIQVSQNIAVPEFNQYDKMIAVAKDAAGNLYAAGNYYYDANYQDDAILIKYSPTMTEEWRRYAFSSSGWPIKDDESIDVHASGGNVHWLVYKPETGYQLTKYSDAGVFLFNVQITTFIPKKVKCNSAGEIYIWGYNLTGINDVYITIQKLTAGGVQIWKKNFNAKVGDFVDNPEYFDVDAAGDVYFTTSSQTALGTDAYLVKYSSAGVKQWNKYVAGTANTTDYGGPFCFDPSGNIYVAHTVTDINGGVTNTNVLIRKYSPTGGILATKYYKGSGNANDKSVGIVYAGNGRIYLGAFTVGTTKRSVVAQYDAALTLEYTDVVVHPETAPYPVVSQNTQPLGFILDAPGNLLYWVGKQTATYPDYLDYQSSIFMIKYSLPAVPRLAQPSNETAISLYPVPASDKVNITASSEILDVAVYDLTGRMIKRENGLQSTEVVINISDFKPGTYLVQVTKEDGEVDALKMIKN